MAKTVKPPRIAEVVLTGGSCAGKTEAVTGMASELRRAGLRVITVPEVATMLIQGGIPDIGEIAREDGDAYCRFQREVFLTHRALRSRARSMAQSFGDREVVILFDRGELDGVAYHAHDCFDTLAAEEGTTLAGIRDSYAAVMHLVTAADGAEEWYSKANNSARWDTAEEARVFDRKILRAWAGHSRHIVLDNHTDFPGKLERLVYALQDVLDCPGQLQIELPNLIPLPATVELELGLDPLAAAAG